MKLKSTDKVFAMKILNKWEMLKRAEVGIHARKKLFFFFKKVYFVQYSILHSILYSTVICTFTLTHTCCTIFTFYSSINFL